MNEKGLSSKTRYDLLFESLMYDIERLREKEDNKGLEDLIGALEGALAFYFITAKDRVVAFSDLDKLVERLREALLKYHTLSS